MNFNTLLLRLGVGPDNFENKEREPIITSDGFIYEVEQRKDGYKCPYCHSAAIYVNSYRYSEISCSETDNIKDTLRIKKVRLKCRFCHKTFTPPIRGIERRSRITQQVERFIYQDFTKPLTFSSIAKRYDLSTARIIQVFDEKVKYVPRRQMSEAMCIDEIRFSEELNQKFVCVLYDFHRREIIDLIKSRQSSYLNDYFSAISTNELNIVKYFISDMYDAYSTICHRYFKKAVHIIDLFHVIKQLTTAINQIRVRTMNTEVSKGSPEYNFMKSHWKYFLCRTSKIPDKFYTHQKTGEVIHYDDLVFRCCWKSNVLLSGYNALQDLYKYSTLFTFTEALDFVEWISRKLLNSGNELLVSVGRTYHKWRIEIANGFAKNQNGIHYTNAIAESINNQLKTIIKSAYGYHNFERFRKRSLLIITYSKKDII